MWFFEMAGIPSAAFVFDNDLATELEIKDFSETEDIKFSCKLLLLPNTGRRGTWTSRSTWAS